MVTTWDAAADQGIEERGQRRDEGLALAGPHLGDRRVVEHDAAHELHVVVPLAERPHHRLSDRCEGLGQDLLERLVDLRQLALALLLQLVGQAGRVGAGKRGLRGILVRIGLAQLDRHHDVVDPLAQAGAELIGLGGELRVAEGLGLRLERVDAIDERLEGADLALVGVPHAGQKLEHRAASIAGFGPKFPQPASTIGLTSPIQRSSVSSSYGAAISARKVEKPIVVAGGHLFGDLLGRADPEGVVVLDVGHRRPVVGHLHLPDPLRLGLGVADDRLAADRALDLRLVATDRLAVGAQDAVLVAELLDGAHGVPHVGVLGHACAASSSRRSRRS